MIALNAHSIAQTTPTGDAIAQAVTAGWALGPVAHCVLLRRGFNQVYELRFESGQHAIARLCTERPRGEPNLAYETALLMHLRAQGVPVAAPWPAADGSFSVVLALPEGLRSLLLFDFLPGDPPGELLADIEATGQGLAQLHDAAQTYGGPPSRYTLDLPLLLDASLDRMIAAPTVDAALGREFSALADGLRARFAALPGLTRVHCHGDCHGSNNFMSDGPHGASEGRRVAAFFDFDDAGPGLLAYELAVYLWVLLPRSLETPLSATVLERWHRYLAGYTRVRAIPAADLAAIAPCLAVRQFWVMGEYAGRIPVWGTQAMPTHWLRKQIPLMQSWMNLPTAEGLVAAESATPIATAQ
ncbi:Ser/Thr protein kinase RdoA (MazF antagonist) [Acidovorax sp. 69]|uniref:phosphotransferase enzyme family protein n=1 Tax=Acidovorax sp. 69 TaxID=2035202 RepID=UPI000C249012|nr:phosphotransferase [Acidovorax sp. 69]PJI96885.1 Ser/Thr protein kinase RdoA (MazF antagonist) [Acidovorax sp. 69]